MQQDIRATQALAARKRHDLEKGYAELLWRHYADNPAEWMADCVWVPSKRDTRGRERMELFEHQHEDLDVLLNSKFVAVLKARQLGMSTLVGALALHRCMFYPGTDIIWVSNNQRNADKAVNSLELMWQFFPDWFSERAPKQTADQASMKEWAFPSGMTSRIIAMAGTSTAGASETTNIVILDEFALVDPHIQDSLLRSTEPTTDAGGQLWILSTARGAANTFAKVWQSADKGDNEYVPIFHPWTTSPFLDEESYEARKHQWEQEGKLHLFYSEYPASPEQAFRESGNPRFGGMIPDREDCFEGWMQGEVQYNKHGTPVFREDDEGSLRLHRDVAVDPPDWRDYVIFVDPASGRGGDYTAAHVLTWDDDGMPIIVGWWHANTIEPVHAARQFDPLGRFFHDALFAVETTGGWGASILNEMSTHCKYPNLYVHTPADKRNKSLGAKLGFPMSWKRRPLVVDRLADYLAGDDSYVANIHPKLRAELTTFVRKEDGKIEADVGCHDDLVMSLAGGIWLLTERTDATDRPNGEEPEEPPSGRGTLKEMFDNIEEARQEKALRVAERDRRIRRRQKARQRRRDRSSSISRRARQPLKMR